MASKFSNSLISPLSGPTSKLLNSDSLPLISIPGIFNLTTNFKALWLIMSEKERKQAEEKEIKEREEEQRRLDL